MVTHLHIQNGQMTISWTGVKIHQNRNNKGIEHMHDDVIVSYNMDFSSKTLEMYTYNEKYNKKGKFIASGVLTYFFESVLESNIILDIDEWKIESFFMENLALLEKMKNHCWPIPYQETQELKDFLVINGYKYIKIVSAYGLFGWVLAKKYEIK